MQKYIPLAYQNQARGMEERFSQNFNKLYYSIGEVADIFGVNASLIRFWEKEFEAIHPKKTAKGNRKFTPKDIETLQKIYDLVKVKGFTLEGAKKVLSSKKLKQEMKEMNEDLASSENESVLKNQLVSIRAKLIALKS